MRVLVFATAAFVVIGSSGRLPAQEPPPGTAAPGAPASGAPGQASRQPARDNPRTPVTGTGVIRGRVTRADTGEPLRRTQVSAQPMQGEARTSISDDEGRYELTRLPAGRYTLRAERSGFVSLDYGQRRPFESGRPVALADAQVLEKMDFAMPRGGAISGRVVDEIGDPAGGAHVQLWRYAYDNGKRRLEGQHGAGVDDRGEFRVFGIPPGEYYVSASFHLSSDRHTYATTYYPGVLSPAAAQRVAVGVGEEVQGITLSLALVRTIEVSGVVRASDGRPAAFAMVMARATGDDAAQHRSEAALSQPDGSFAIDNLPPGKYVIEARSPLSAAADFATVETEVNETDVTGLVLVMSPGATARGRIRFDGGQPPAHVRPADVRILSSARDGETMLSGELPRRQVRDDWTFEVTGLHGRRNIDAFALPSWTVKSVHLQGADVTDTFIDFREDVEGIEITLTDRLATIAGRVVDDRGDNATDSFVVVFAADRDKWSPRTRFIRSGRPDQDGRFTVTGLPAAEYKAIAIDYLEPGEELNPELLEQWHPRGTAVTLGDGETRTLDLKLSTF